VGDESCRHPDPPPREELERQLRDSQTRLEVACGLAGLSSYHWDPPSGALVWDERLKALWGLPPGVEPTLALWQQGIHPDDRAKVLAASAAVLDPSGEGSGDIQYRVVGLQGGPERWVRTYGRTRFEEGRAVSFIGAILDITDQMRAAELFRRSEERLRSFAEGTHEILWILNPGMQRLEYLSPGFEPTAGVSAEAAMADVRVWEGCIHPEDRAARARTLARVAEGGESLTQEYRIVRPDGSVRTMRDTAFPIADSESGIARIGGIAHEIGGGARACVYLVGSRQAVRDVRAAALRHAGHEVATFATESLFLDVAASLAAGCVVVSADDAGPARFALAQVLRARRADLRLVYEADLAGDVGLAVLAMKSGAADVLQSPVDLAVLLLAVASALSTLRDTEQAERVSQAACEQIAHMSRREREVLDGLLGGGTNKTIARDLGISPRTVEIYRARVMERLGAHTVPEAVLAAAAAGLRPGPARQLP
jgi:PAS domain S-box-containing protein